MSKRPSRICAPCGYRIAHGELCPCERKRKQDRDNRHDAVRGTSTKRGYDSDWRKARDKHLEANPWCVECTKEGKLRPAVLVDHVKRIKAGGSRLDASNFQSLCATHHNSTKQRRDARERKQEAESVFAR